MVIFVKLTLTLYLTILFDQRQVFGGAAHARTSKNAKPSFSTSLESVSHYYDENEASGNGKNQHIDDNSYDDDEKTEGSTYGSGDDLEPALPKKMTKCLQILEGAKGPGSFMPRCTYDGRFDALQCHGSECWCSTPNGQKIEGTTRMDPDTPKCGSINNNDNNKSGATKQTAAFKSTKQPESRTMTSTTTTTKSSSSSGVMMNKNGHMKKQHSKSGGGGNTNVIVDGIKTHDHKNTDLNTPYDNVGSKSNNNIPQNKKPTLKKIHPNRNNINSNNKNNFHFNLSTESQSMHKIESDEENKSTLSQFISQPGILAGIICVGAITLLCFVTILTYTIFKLRHRSSSYNKEKTQTKPVVKVNTNPNSEIINSDSYYRNGGMGGHNMSVGGGGFGDIYTGGGFSYTPGYSPARCNTMSNKMSPWSPAAAAGMVSNTTVRNSAGYSKCLDRNFYA